MMDVCVHTTELNDVKVAFAIRNGKLVALSFSFFNMDEAINGLVRNLNIIASRAKDVVNVSQCRDKKIIKRIERMLSGVFLGRNNEQIPLGTEFLTQFEREVYKKVKEIEYGGTATYSEIAKKLKSSPRAVALALSRNPLPLIIPCHRVIKADGSAGGYAGRENNENKRILLDMEKRKA